MKEQQPHGITELEQKLGKIDVALGKANRVSQTIGTPEFGRPELDISPSSQLEGVQYLDAAIKVGRVRKALAENAIPRLTTLKDQTQIQFNNLEVQNENEKEEKLQLVRELVGAGYIPATVLERTREKLAPQPEITIDKLDLPIIIRNVLRRGGIKTVGQLLQSSREDLLRLRNMGTKTLAVIEGRLKEKGIALAEDEILINPDMQAQSDINIDTTQKPKSPRMLQVEKALGIDIVTYLKEEYEAKGRSAQDITHDITNKTNAEIRVQLFEIYDWLKKFRINTRSAVEAAKLSRQDPVKREAALARLATAKQVAAQTLQARVSDNPKEVLEDLYFKQGLSMRRIAERYGISNHTITRWFKILEITHKETTVRHPIVIEQKQIDIFDRARVLGFLTMLEPRENHILEDRHIRGKTLENIGTELGISTERVRQIQLKALSKLRRQLHNLG